LPPLAILSVSTTVLFLLCKTLKGIKGLSIEYFPEGPKKAFFLINQGKSVKEFRNLT
jgi:hypothetical protein